MKIVVSKVSAIKPSILRVHAYTYRDDTSDAIQDFELAIAVQDFIDTTNPNDVLIDVDRFKELITKFIADAFDTANLATALNSIDLEWEVNTSAPVKQEKDAIPESVKGSKLAYGDTHDNT